MDKINFINQHNNFPVSTYTYDLVQNMVHLAGKLASLGGQNYILSGCTVAGNIASEGLIVINGEILPFKGGEVKNKVTIQVVYESDHYADVTYREAYIHRTAIFSDTGEYDWSDFAQVYSNELLQKHIEAIKGDAPGTVKMWAGLVSRIPAGYMLCDGTPLLIEEYPELYKNLELSFGGDATSFRLPNLKNKFIVGFDVDKEDYNKIGNTGGLETVTLTKEQMPEHDHTTNSVYDKLSARAADTASPGTAGSVDARSPDTEYNIAGMTPEEWLQSKMKKEGGNKPHENRPPYFVLAYIIKVK